MASPFQRYQGGIQPVTGMAEAGANIGKMYQQGLNQLGANIGEGLRIYGENQKNSEAADATIASGVARFKSIADVYGQDPEFAPIVAQFAERLKQYEKAPSMSYAKKAVAANEINMLGQDLAQMIQAQQVVRGRQIERVGGELLSQFKGVEKVTDPAFVKEGVNNFNTGKDFISNEGEFVAGLNRFREAAKAAGREIKGTDAEALDAYRRNVQDSVNQAMSAGTLDKAVGSRIIEQVEAQRNLGAVKSGVVGGGATMGDLETLSKTAYQAPEQVDVTKFAPTFQEGIKKLTEAANKESSIKSQQQSELNIAGSDITKDVLNGVMERIEKGENITSSQVRKLLYEAEVRKNPTTTPIVRSLAFGGAGAGFPGGGFQTIQTAPKTLSPASKVVSDALNKIGKSSDAPLSANEILSLSKQLAPKVDEFKKASEKMADTAKKIASGQAPTQETQPAPAPVLSLGKMAVGSVEYERKVNQAEKKAKIAELMTQRIGIIDPVTGKKSLPAGFEAYYKQMVPESDARVVDVDGIKLLWNGKGFEQVKMEQAKMPTAKEIGENSAFVFGVQTDRGIQPTELVPNSGVLISGIVSGSTAGAEKVREQLTDLIDLRSSVSRLQEINDKMGEFASLRDQGISQYDLMKLRAVLTKQVNVSGSISDYERKEIAKMTPDPTAFLDFEPKTRAALLGIALGIDRDIKTLATSRGLSVVMTGNSGMTQNQSLRQKFLSEKSK